jgi:[FeFe] hydrogenase (group B1/B3)
MLEINNQYTVIKRKIDTEVLKAFFAGTLQESVDKLPIKIIPRDRDPNRCCVYKERAMVRYRIMALLGIDIEQEDDDYRSLASYVQQSWEIVPSVFPLLSTIAPGCSSCPDEQYRITDSCRGCFARPCIANCPKEAIRFVNGRAFIDEQRCIKCGKCLDVCPFHAVIQVPVPCEHACPVDAIHKNAQGFVEIDRDICINCGHCSRSCPFGAIVERSSLLHVADMLKGEQKVIAMVAPAIEGQFPGSLGQIIAGLKAVGFSDVVEVAEGAQITASHEAHEVGERIEAGFPFMTTSCCPAYMQLVDKHVPTLSAYRSQARSPMAYTAHICSDRYPQAKLVFIGPCLAKKVEAADVPEISSVITFTELASLFVARDVDIREMPEDPMVSKAHPFSDCREFAVAQGVANSVLRRCDNPLQTLNINGIDRKTVRIMKTWTKKVPEAQLVEVMCCEGGCLAGPGVLVNPKIAHRLRQGVDVATVGTRPIVGGNIHVQAAGD